jgi:triosephosphate isomerase
MKEIYVNLKRFEVPRRLGGLCPVDKPTTWIETVVQESVDFGLGALDNLHLVYLLPESLIPAAITKLNQLPKSKTRMMAIGCQGVHWEDIKPGKNFGAFTSCLPATAAKSTGSTWAMIGHSEERKAKQQVISAFTALQEDADNLNSQAGEAVNQLLQDEVKCALEAGLNILLCVGESAEERGGGSFEEQKPRIESILKSQLISNLEPAVAYKEERKIAIGYEPIWAIGPGKTPPGGAYINFVSEYIKKVIGDNFDFSPSVVYGGGLKEENAGMIAGIKMIDGGLVALTRFTGEIGFDVAGLRGIVDKYLA